jgi:tetratricopeptide (TPR) repeat protein
LEVLLNTGRPKEAQERLKDNLRAALSNGMFEQMQAVAAVALGDYASAIKYLAEAEQKTEKPPTERLVALQKDLAQEEALRQLGMLVQVPIGGSTVPLPPLRSALSSVIQDQKALQINPVASAVIRAAELRLMRGLLAMEVGDMPAATEHFRAMVAMVPANLGFAERMVAQRYLELLERK